MHVFAFSPLVFGSTKMEFLAFPSEIRECPRGPGGQPRGISDNILGSWELLLIIV